MKRERIDLAVWEYFQDVAVDVNGMVRAANESRTIQLRDIRLHLRQAEQDEVGTLDRLARVRRDYQDGRVEAEDWSEQRVELLDQLRAAGAAASQLRAQEDALRHAPALSDASELALQTLAQVRKTIAGEIVTDADIESARIALRQVFSHFVLHSYESGSLPSPLEGELALADYYIEPVARPEMILQPLILGHGILSKLDAAGDEDMVAEDVEQPERLRRVRVSMRGELIASAR